MADTVVTQHPDKDKAGVRIDKAEYEAVPGAMLAALRAQSEMTFRELSRAVEKKLGGKSEAQFSGT